MPREYDPDDYSDTLETGFCTDCGKECRIILIDEGIGSYEYWGQKGVHHDYRRASYCCEADVLDSPPAEPESCEDDPGE